MYPEKLYPTGHEGGTAFNAEQRNAPEADLPENPWQEVSEKVIGRLAGLSISDREYVRQLMTALDEDATQEGIQACVVTLAEILENRCMKLTRWPLPEPKVDADGFVVGEDAE